MPHPVVMSKRIIDALVLIILTELNALIIGKHHPRPKL